MSNPQEQKPFVLGSPSPMFNFNAASATPQAGANSSPFGAPQSTENKPTFAFGQTSQSNTGTQPFGSFSFGAGGSAGFPASGGSASSSAATAPNVTTPNFSFGTSATAPGSSFSTSNAAPFGSVNSSSTPFGSVNSNATGFNQTGSSATSFNPASFNPTGFNAASSNPTSFNQTGSNQSTFNVAGSNPTSFNATGSSATGFNQAGSNATPFSAASSNQSTFTATASNQSAFNPTGSNQPSAGPNFSFPLTTPTAPSTAATESTSAVKKEASSQPQSTMFNFSAPSSTAPSTTGSSFSLGGNSIFSFTTPSAPTTTAPITAPSAGSTLSSAPTTAPSTGSTFSFAPAPTASATSTPSATGSSAPFSLSSAATGSSISSAPNSSSQSTAAPFSFSSTTAPASNLSSKPATSQNVFIPSTIKNKSLQEIASKFSSDLEMQTKSFHRQAISLFQNDLKLIENGEEITKLIVKANELNALSKDVSHQLDFVQNQQAELERIIEALEKSLPESLPNQASFPSFGAFADQSRGEIYDLYFEMQKDLGEVEGIVERVSSKPTNLSIQEEDSSLANWASLMRILNVHEETLENLNCAIEDLQVQKSQIAHKAFQLQSEATKMSKEQTFVQ